MRDDGCSPYILIIHIHFFSNKYLVFFMQASCCLYWYTFKTNMLNWALCDSHGCQLLRFTFKSWARKETFLMIVCTWKLLGNFQCRIRSIFIKWHVINRSSVQTSLETRLKGDSHILIVHNHMHQSHEIQPIYLFAWRAPFEHAKQTSRCK